MYAAFLKGEAERGDHTFLLNDIGRSNLRPAAKLIASEIIEGKLKRKRGAAPSHDTELVDVQRALRVRDLEADGWTKRLAAETEAASQLQCSVSAVQKALGKYEDMLKAADTETLDRIRSLASKSAI